MNMTCRFLPALLAMLALGVPLASAEELAVGGYGAGSPAGFGAGGMGQETPSSYGPGDGGGVVLNFTPRGGGLFESDQDDGTPRMRFELSVAGAPLDEPNAFEIGAAETPSWLAEPKIGLGELSIGGALRWSEWSVGGGFGRTALMGGEADLMSATVGYGSLTASLGYGEASGVELRPMDVLMLSTDLAATSWLSLESDVAVGSRPDEEESVAVGRLGVRLNF
jgi:hypothetical protein